MHDGGDTGWLEWFLHSLAVGYLQSILGPDADVVGFDIGGCIDASPQDVEASVDDHADMVVAAVMASTGDFEQFVFVGE